MVLQAGSVLSEERWNFLSEVVLCRHESLVAFSVVVELAWRAWP